MAERTAGVDPAVDELRRKARRRLVGAVVLALAAAVILPMLLEKEPRPLGEDVAVQIPPVDEGRFVNRLSNPAPATTASTDSTKAPAVAAPPAAGTARPDADAAEAAQPSAASSGAAAPGVSAAPLASSQASASAAGPSSGSGERAVASASAPSAPADGQSAPADVGPAPVARKSVADVEQHVINPSAPVPGTAVRSGQSERSTQTRVEAKPAVQSKEAAAVAMAAAHTQPADPFVVQLAAFSDDKGANALASRLKRNGYAAYTEPVKTSRGTLYRVRVGGYATREAAGNARARLKGQGYSGIVARR